MKNSFPLFFLLFASYIFGQQTFLIKDKASDQALEQVKIYNQNREVLSISNEDGVFMLNDKQELIYVEHPGFPSQSFQLPVEQNIIYLDSDLVNLRDIQVVANDDKSLKLIKKVIENQKRNNPKSLGNFKYKSYTKLWADGQGDSIAYIPNPKTSQDSAQNQAKKLLENSMLFLSERAISHYYDKRMGIKNKVEAARISGLNTPLYELIALQPISTEFNEDEFNFFFRKFTNPLSLAGLKAYNYIITDSIQQEGRNLVEVSFNTKKKEKKSLQGYALIDLESFALSKFYAENKTKAGSYTYIEMIYEPYKNVWIPSRQVFKIDADNLSYYVKKDSINEKGEKVEYNLNKTARSWLNSHTTFSDFEAPVELDSKVFKGYESEVNKKAFTEFNEKIDSFRESTLNERELNTYVKIDSIGKAQNVDRNIQLLRVITQQAWLNFGNFDVYLLDLLQFNDYEDYRVGLNLRTSHKFSQKFGLNARTFYGTTDKVVKYGLGAWLKVNPNNDAEVYVDYSDDIASAARFSHPNLNLLNAINERTEKSSDYLFIDKINAQVGYRQDFFRNLKLDLSLNMAKERSLFEYTYKDNSEDKTYKSNTLRAAFRFAPREESIQTPMGKFAIKGGLPTYYLKVEKGLNLLDGETDFTRLEFSTNQKLDIFKTSTLVNLRMGKVFGEVPIWHYFGGLGRGRDKEQFWQRARMGGSQIFETMAQGEFISDQYVFGSIKQRVLNLKLVKDKNIPIHMLYKAGYGSLDKKENHTGLIYNEMDQVYQEVGLEINNLVMKVFGLGLYYRLGAYNTGEFKNDFSVKAVFNFGI
ncbi:DUF5686 family protein [Weeksellaceae bacterium KMM 9724]|uniref:DUF5686 family protein n=1 Tax=Profundicola chukchiensis TaxID=2961959 RepID=UPI00243FB12D|nr:DUF5686 family protein [Profundicola chukchiensis]MDG4951020.1 DUF5686 family protein [Profundicola chukchiensis]